jgi:dolichol-phosphate mannosyltransferase
LKNNRNLKTLISRLKDSQEGARMIRFYIVGASGIGVCLGILWLLTEKVHVYYVLSNAIGFELSVINNFVWNEKWTFKDRVENRSMWQMRLKRLLQYNSVSVFTLLLNTAILFGLTHFLGLYYMISAIVGILVAAVFNYGINSTVTWK